MDGDRNRDAKILTIYEGTTAIQANDLVGRKTVRDGGATAKVVLARVRETQAQLAACDGADMAAILRQLTAASSALEDVVDYVVNNTRSDIKAVFAGSVTYLKLAGLYRPVRWRARQSLRWRSCCFGCRCRFARLPR